MIRIAQVMAGAPQGGAELFYERLTLALVRAGDAVLPVIRRDPGRAARLDSGGARPAQLRFAGPLDLLTGLRLRALLRRHAPRAVVAWMNRAALHTPRGAWALIGRLGGYYDLRYYRRCDHLVGNTRGLADWIVRQGWPAARTHYLPNFAADLSGAPPAPRASLGVPDGAKLVLALGRLHPNKAFDILVRAMPSLPGAHAVIAGEGQARASLAALAAAEGVADRVHLPGWRADTGALLAACDVLVCPSRHEPLGNVVIEGWSAGRPVVAAASQGPRELIADGTDGLLCPTDDPAALAAALAAILADPARAAALAAAGRARFAHDFAEAPVLAAWRGFLSRVERA